MDSAKAFRVPKDTVAKTLLEALADRFQWQVAENGAALFLDVKPWSLVDIYQIFSGKRHWFSG